jgi:hypothetical protein
LRWIPHRLADFLCSQVFLQRVSASGSSDAHVDVGTTVIIEGRLESALRLRFATSPPPLFLGRAIALARDPLRALHRRPSSR